MIVWTMLDSNLARGTWAGCCLLEVEGFGELKSETSFERSVSVSGVMLVCVHFSFMHLVSMLHMYRIPDYSARRRKKEPAGQDTLHSRSQWGQSLTFVCD